MKRRKEDGKIYLNFSYDMYFANQLKKFCGAKWNAETKEWYFDEEYEDKSNDLMLKRYAYSFRSDEKIRVELKAWDFYDKKNGIVVMNGIPLVWRENRDCGVKVRYNVIIKNGDFPARGGSRKYPEVNIDETCDVVLTVVLHKEFYDTLSEEQKSKITVVSESSKAEILEKRREQLLKELAEIEKQMQEQ